MYGSRLLGVGHLTGFSHQRAIAQVIGDRSLMNESSIVTPIATPDVISDDAQPSTYSITGGARRDSNLFHSFEQFSVQTGEIASFANSSSVENIISRVTGNAVSNINGTLQTQGNANLFLLNPAGIVFGSGAQLDIGGSFLASTGGLRFDNGFLYSGAIASPPPLLTISTPIGLELNNPTGSILSGDIRFSDSVDGRAGNTANSTPINLSVTAGESITLVGKTVSLSNAQLRAPGGGIAVGGVREASTLPISSSRQGLDVDLTEISQAGDIQIANQSVLDTSGEQAGRILLQGDAVTLSDQSALISDTFESLQNDHNGAMDSHSRDSRIQVFANRFGLQGGSFIGSATQSATAASDIDIQASDRIEIRGLSENDLVQRQLLNFLGARQISDRRSGGIFSTTTGAGGVGNVSLSAPSILFAQGAGISTETLGTGRSGNIDIRAESVQLQAAGIFTNSLVPGVPTLTLQGGGSGLSTAGIPAGAAGDITVNTARFVAEGGSAVSASTLSDRPSGNITVNATDAITLRGASQDSLFSTTIVNISFGGNGNVGTTTVNTGRLSLEDGSTIFTSSGSRVLDGFVEFGGTGGDISITATESVSVLGGRNNPTGFVFGELGAETYSDSAAGNIEIITPVLNVLDGGRITTATLGTGQGGQIDITAQEIVVEGQENEVFPSLVSANSGLTNRINRITGEQEPLAATGEGGRITLDTTNLSIRNGGQVSVGGFGSGSAGNLSIAAADSVELNNRGQMTATNTEGPGGNIDLSARRLISRDSSITAVSSSNDGGNLSLMLRNLLLMRDSNLISTEAGTAGAGGNGGRITIDASNGFIVAVPNENSDIRANAFEGNGGNVSITARNLLGIAFRPGLSGTPASDITSSSEFGNSGTVTINEINTNNLEPETELPVETAPETVAQGCRGQGTQTGRFVSTGRGGLPTSPTTPLSSHSIWQDIEALSVTGEDSASQQIESSRRDIMSEANAPIHEAQGWQRAADGTVVLLHVDANQSVPLSQADLCG
ncbi:MAG: filamentous hemagglutinin N-terminal domain-containing protein [Cyanobacteria bacterium J06649_4]